MCLIATVYLTEVRPGSDIRAAGITFYASKGCTNTGRFPMKVLVVSEFKAQDDRSVDQNALIAEAGKILNDLHERGILKTVYLRKDQPGTVILFECGTVEDADQYMSKFPGVIQGTTEYHLIPLGSELPPHVFLGARMAGH